MLLRGWSTRAWALWLVVVAAATSACQANVEVLVTVNEDGSGEVATIATIDPDSSEGLLELDATGLVLGDLAQAGWDVEPPAEGIDGSTVVTATKEFGTPSQFAEVMDEITGDGGPLRDFELVRTKSFARVDYELTGVIDTTGDLSTFGDPALEGALGRPLTAIAGRYGATGDQVGLRLEFVLPGERQTEAPTGLMDSEAGQVRSEWMASLADDEVVPVSLASATTQSSALVLRGVAVVAAALALLLVFAQLLRVLIPDRHRPGRRRASARPPARPSSPSSASSASAPAGPGLGEDPGAEEGATALAPDLPRVVALDAMGVLYREGDDVRKLLVPFARERGATAPPEEIVARARNLSLGRITTGQFWRAIGISDQTATAELDDAYLGLHQLTPGVIKYLRALRERGQRCACITNDAASWATDLKRRHDLEGLIDPWVVSGAVGVRKPDRPIFEVLRRVTGEPESAIQIVDDDLDVLDIARDLGFATAWFAPDATRDEARGHPMIRGFEVFEEEAAEPVPPQI